MAYLSCVSAPTKRSPCPTSCELLVCTKSSPMPYKLLTFMKQKIFLPNVEGGISSHLPRRLNPIAFAACAMSVQALTVIDYYVPLQTRCM